VQSKWAEIEKEQTEFVDQVTNELLERTFPIGSGQASLTLLMQHLVNHSSYHRGQIALMLGQLGIRPPETDFHVFLAKTAVEVLAAPGRS
jgi:uncharacterized damage-inducible protein DinB